MYKYIQQEEPADVISQTTGDDDDDDLESIGELSTEWARAVSLGPGFEFRA